jgi:succinoglycan biosynthesis protein ExoA
MTTISIIVPVKHGGYVAAFDSIRRSGLDKNSYEVLLAEGCAPSQQRNLASRAASGDILYFVDDDSILNPENLWICCEAMKDTDVAVVGGPSLTPDSDTWIQHLFAAALSSSLGAGAVRNRYRVTGSVRETTERELILCNLAIRRSVFIEMGGFNEGLYPNEENELLDRIKSAGFKLIHAPNMSILRSQRTTIKAFIRQMFVYGRGRAQQSLISGSFPLVSFIPMFFVLYVISSIFYFNCAPCFFPMLLYFSVVVLFTIIETCLYQRLNILLLFFLYPLMHFVNGLGLIAGLINGKPLPVSDGSILVTKVKMFGHDFV